MHVYIYIYRALTPSLDSDEMSTGNHPPQIPS